MNRAKAVERSDPPQPPGSTRHLLVRLVREHVRPHLGRLLLAGLCMVLAAGSIASLAYLMEPVLDEIFLKKDRSLLIVVPIAVIG